MYLRVSRVLVPRVPCAQVGQNRALTLGYHPYLPPELRAGPSASRPCRVSSLRRLHLFLARFPRVLVSLLSFTDPRCCVPACGVADYKEEKKGASTVNHTIAIRRGSLRCFECLLTEAVARDCSLIGSWLRCPGETTRRTCLASVRSVCPASHCSIGVARERL